MIRAVTDTNIDVLSRTKFAKHIADVGSSVDEMLGDYLALVQAVRPIEQAAAN